MLVLNFPLTWLEGESNSQKWQWEARCQFCTHKIIAYISLGEAGTELFGFLEVAAQFYTTGESAGKKTLKAEERAVWIV